MIAGEARAKRQEGVDSRERYMLEGDRKDGRSSVDTDET